MSKQPHVWVVEINLRGQWEPCDDAALTKGDAKDTIAEWEARNPYDQFRVAKYVRVEPKKGRKT